MMRMPYTMRSRLGLGPRAGTGERVYAIGDVHGSIELLNRLMAKIREDHAKRKRMPMRLIVLGDFLDRGDNSAEVLQKLRLLDQASDRVCVLLGNHESALLDCTEGNAEAQEEWLRYGGDTTLRSFDIAPPKSGESAEAFALRVTKGIGEENLDWLRDRPLSARSGDYFFCHAGVRPYIPLHRQSADDLLTIRDEFLESEVDHGAVIVHGHSIVNDGAEIRHNRINVDSGAYQTGKLTAVGLEGTAQWLVEASI
ncbi:metallophosphoesterase family protein [Alteraurantiacibacter aquimixticola]|uniref:Serine/threonine protein phosphatase n=1 Tax=Alteraurantiacibacter aquimixticola TaxID=2489173 RepID=A0A4T3F6E9_9SPHN|nr:metallophosphoesterase family protein [Alteraurantiacibacter aquimixticola]TIX51242.1 serine/threonine protein phosphatase [Alteraurantiacibacter aquimixticola]